MPGLILALNMGLEVDFGEQCRFCEFAVGCKKSTFFAQKPLRLFFSALD